VSHIVIDPALIYSWILFREFCKLSDSRQVFIQRVLEFMGTALGKDSGKAAAAQRNPDETGEKRKSAEPRSSAGLTIVANVAIATGPALLGTPRSSAMNLIYHIIYFFQSNKSVFCKICHK